MDLNKKGNAPTSAPVRIRAADMEHGIQRFAAVATTRLAYSSEDNQGRSVAIEMMRELGLEVRIDAAGNIFGRREGARGGLPILFGSHIDTVRNAGRYDGVLGVVSGIECIRLLCEMDHRTEHPLELVIFANEEGQNYSALLGSRALVGDFDSEELKLTDAGGRPLSDAIRQIGGNPENLASAILQPGNVLAFLEVHVEQGGELESLGTPIGVVEGISGIQQTDVVISGTANHSGTTAMGSRKDAMVAAAEFILAVRRIAAEKAYCRVATVGRVMVFPNSANIVPGQVDLTLEIRDMHEERMTAALKLLQEEASLITARSGVQFTFENRKRISPVPADPRVIAAIRASCEALDVSFHLLPSGAGHDAQMMARIAPMGMIFVPSIGGISHSTAEFTSAEDCALGADILLHAILRLDQQHGFRPWGSPQT
jgi:beta-ureidopropionase / N-carbamoyl-L-amino-acid hydrolase